MFLQTPNKPVRLTTAAKARAGLTAHHSHKIETIVESSRKQRSPDGYANSPPSPSSSNDVMVFTNSYNHTGGRSSGHNSSRNLPEYPNIDEMQRYLQDVWDQKMRELNDPSSKLKCLNLGKPMTNNDIKSGNCRSSSKDGSNSSSSSSSPASTSSQPPTPVKQQRSSPHQQLPHNNHSSSSTNSNSTGSSSSNHRRF